MSNQYDPLKDPSLEQFLARVMRNPSQRKAYLASRAWYTRKQALALRSQGKCERCGFGRYQVAHHLTYRHFGAEFLNELLAVCKDCHQFLHARSNVDPATIKSGQGHLEFD